jgi:D-alanyl-lipoteichoic acid acyltransferase DltB (MBOAT superfamily)
VLFNTLAYAQFLAIVFVIAWTLVSRRWAPLLPAFGVVAFAILGDRSPSSLLTAASAFALSLALCRKLGDDETPPWRVAVTSVVINLAALGFLSWRSLRSDPLTAALRALNVPVPNLSWVHVLGAAAALGLTLALVRAKKIRLLFILGASYVFYAHWDYRFLPLIFGSSTIDWLLGHAIHRAKTPRSRKAWLVGTVIVNLGILAVFKYYNFGVDSAVAALGALGIDLPRRTLDVALPVGISFFTFESMSYVIDVYRGDIEPQKSYFEYLSFVAFFPHLVAGPIVRPRDLLPQLAGPARWNPKEGSEGLFLIGVGLIKKVAIGDYLAVNLVDRVFDAPIQYSALENYCAVLGYAVQIYCDFSGYTDIAIGSALLLGVRFPLNFNAPYKAANIQDFWRRWHISLSTWLRDYLYIPLGGNRKGEVRTYVNLMLTMLLGGLWHGAAWTFVVWGGIHGAALSVTRFYQEKRAARTSVRAANAPPDGAHPTVARPGVARPVTYVLSVLATFHVVCAAWIFFRADSFRAARVMFSQIASLSTYHPNLSAPVVAILALGLVSHFVPERWYQRSQHAFIQMPAPAQAAALFCVALILRRMASAEAVPFVYFQF